MVAPKSSKQRKWLTKVILISLTLILVLLLSTQVQAKELSAKLDRHQAEMGDILTLIIKTDFQTFESPNFSVLTDQFDLLGTQRSNQIQIINGDYQAFARWDVRLTPKQAGELRIPPLEVASIQSQPIKVNVSKGEPIQGEGRGSSFFESSVNITDPYVQQEVIYTLRFFHLGNLVRGNIRPPVFENAITQNLRQQYNYQKQIDGRLYEVYEWTWAFYPQKSGEMTIAKQRFDGRIQLGVRMKQVRDETNTLTLNVKPKPTHYPAQADWLPAQKLQLSEEWQAPKTLRVGDSITRSFNLQAMGLQGSQLPKFELTPQATFNSYPDQAKTRNHPQTDKQMTVVGQLTQKIAIVPTEAGTITLPEIRLPWWNTQTNQQEEAILPAKQFTVLPAVQSQSATDTPTQDPIEVPRETVSFENESNSINTYYWLLLVGFLAFGWLMTLVAYFRLKNQSQKINAGDQTDDTESTDANHSAQISKQQPCQTRPNEPLDAKLIYSAWLKQENPGLEHPAEFTQLQAHLYGGETLDVESEQQLLKQLCALLQKQTEQHHNDKPASALQPIYPE